MLSWLQWTACFRSQLPALLAGFVGVLLQLRDDVASVFRTNSHREVATTGQRGGCSSQPCRLRSGGPSRTIRLAKVSLLRRAGHVPSPI